MLLTRTHASLSTPQVQFCTVKSAPWHVKSYKIPVLHDGAGRHVYCARLWHHLVDWTKPGRDQLTEHYIAVPGNRKQTSRLSLRLPLHASSSDLCSCLSLTLVAVLSKLVDRACPRSTLLLRSLLLVHLHHHLEVKASLSVFLWVNRSRNLRISSFMSCYEIFIRKVHATWQAGLILKQ